jgi:hypothetical protein
MKKTDFKKLPSERQSEAEIKFLQKPSEFWSGG